MNENEQMQPTIEIAIGEVSDMEARLYATYNVSAHGHCNTDAAHVSLTGSVRGPYCETAETLPAKFPFRELTTAPPEISPNNSVLAVAEAVISDPCTWSAELPHLYQVDVEAHHGDKVTARYHGQLGLRRTTPRRTYDIWE